MLPYLVAKREAADIGISLIDGWVSIAGSSAANEEIARRQYLHQSLMAVNAKGIDRHRLDPAMTTRGKFIHSSESDRAYLAGLIDGDGSIIIGRTVKKRRTSEDFVKHELRLSVVNTNPRLISWLLNTFGGALVVRGSRNDGWKTTYEWKLAQADSAEVLRLVGVHLVQKVEQASVALALVDSGVKLTRGSCDSDKRKEVARRESLYAAMRNLNQRGNTAATTKYQALQPLAGEAIV